MADLTLAALPSNVLVAVGTLLDTLTLVHWMCTARPFYDVLVGVLYRRDLLDENGDGQQLGLRAGLAGNVAALQRALAVHPPLPETKTLYADALGGDRPLDVIACLLATGVTDQDTKTKDNIWPLLQTALEAAQRPPRWCPVPVVSLLFAHGHTLASTATASGSDGDVDVDIDVQRAVWARAFSLVQVRGPRPRRRGGSKNTTATADELRHDHCQHGSDACNVAMMRAMLQQGKARPGGGELQLVARAMQDARRPVDLLRCLADAGADLEAAVPSASSLSSSMCTPLLAALEDALRLASFAHNPRGRLWDCHPPHVVYPKAGDVVQFLLSRGVGGDDVDGAGGDSRTLRLLNVWDEDWRRHRRQPARTRKKGNKKQRLR